MTRYARTMQFRKEINEEYFLNIIEYYKKNRLNGVNDYEIQKIICDNFEYFYENVEMIENIEKMVPGLIEWGSYFPAYIDSGYIRLGLSSARKLHLKWIEKYPEKDWNRSYISKNPNLQIEWIEKMDKMGLIDWFNVSRNPNLQLTWLERFSEKPWDWNDISRNPNLQIKWLETYLYTHFRWKLYIISTNPNLQLKWIERFPDKEWDWESISVNKNLQLDWLIRFPKKSWNWKEIYKHPNFTNEWRINFT